MIGSKKWWKAAGIRALKTIAQTAAASIGAAAVLSEVNWWVVLSASALSGILSLLTSLAGLPEVSNDQYYDENFGFVNDTGFEGAPTIGTDVDTFECVIQVKKKA